MVTAPVGICSSASQTFNWKFVPRRWIFSLVREFKSKIGSINGAVVGWEKVQVPAGEFEALKIVLNTEVKDADKVSSGTDISWYVPALRRSVKSELVGHDMSTGQEEKKIVRLISYKVQ